MLKKEFAFLVFKISFVALLIINIAEVKIPSETDLIPFINVSEIPLLKYIFILFFAFLIIPFKEYINLLKKQNIIVVIILLFILICIGFISSFFSEFQQIGFNICGRITFYFFIFIIVFTASQYFKNSIDFLIKSSIYSNVLIIIGSLLDFYIPKFHKILVIYFNRPDLIHSYIQIGDEKIMRPMGFITDSNLAAFSLALALLLILLNYKCFNKFFKISFYITGSFVLGMLSSRASLIVCIFCFIVFFVFNIIEKKELIIFGLLFLICNVATPQTYGRVLSYLDKKEIVKEYAVGRPIIWEASFNVFKENPVIGIGPGGFFEVSQIYVRNILKKNPTINIDNPELPGYHKIDKWNPHNIFLVMLSETGLIGSLSFILLILYLIWFYKNNKKYISLLFFFSVMFVSSLSNFAPYYKYYLIIGIIIYVASINNLKIVQTNLSEY